jgi:hypothetical protein
MQNRLNAFCKRLLESPRNANDSPRANTSSEYLLNQNADFLHHTVRDFMETTYIEGFLREWATSTFQVDLVICEAIIAQIKTAPRSIYCFRKDGLVPQFISAFFHAERLNNIDLKGALEMRLLKDLDSTLTAVEWQMKSRGFEGIYYGALGDSSISLAATRHGLSGHPRNNTATGEDGRTPLWAAGSGHEVMVRLLVKRDDVEADSKDEGGRKPLSWVAEESYDAVVWLLVEREDVKADSKSLCSRTPLSYAV